MSLKGWAFMRLRRFIRPGTTAVYMTRLEVIRTPRWLTVCINWIHEPDRDPRLHNHPWKRMWKLVLRGGYVEQVTESGRIRIPPRWGRVPQWHRIHSVSWVVPMTLFIGWDRSQRWGMRNPDGSIAYRGPDNEGLDQ